MEMVYDVKNVKFLNNHLNATNELEQPTKTWGKMTFAENFSSFNENEKFSSGDYRVSDFEKGKYVETLGEFSFSLWVSWIWSKKWRKFVYGNFLLKDKKTKTIL